MITDTDVTQCNSGSTCITQCRNAISKVTLAIIIIGGALKASGWDNDKGMHGYATVNIRIFELFVVKPQSCFF